MTHCTHGGCTTPASHTVTAIDLDGNTHDQRSQPTHACRHHLAAVANTAMTTHPALHHYQRAAIIEPLHNG